ncbi:MAG: ABC transporter permease subunit [Sphaerochaetaceae bacterium]|nr:ABC transporter permease subunit [Sphaerochaetaceae bacterium]MDC7238120.1 ABC transporter permease subunit [Sphaerochaetaceae bacterium]
MFKIQKDKLGKIAAFLLVISFLVYIFFFSIDNLNYKIILQEKEKLILALLSTLYISIVTLLISLISGFIFNLFQNINNVFFRTLSKILREIIMGTPLLVMIFLIVYVFGIRIQIYNKTMLGIIALSLYMTPYMANSYEAAMSIISERQYLVMELYDFNFFQKYRYIILPQIIKPFLPSMINNLSIIIKGSALLKIISVGEIAYIITVISNKSYASIEGYLVMWIMYLIITIPLSLLASHFAKRFSL